MKTLILVSSLVLAAVFALILASASLETAVAVFVTAGFAAIAFTDYSRRARPLALAPVPVIPGRTERLGLAA